MVLVVVGGWRRVGLVVSREQKGGRGVTITYKVEFYR